MAAAECSRYPLEERDAIGLVQVAGIEREVVVVLEVSVRKVSPSMALSMCFELMRYRSRAPVDSTPSMVSGAGASSP